MRISDWSSDVCSSDLAFAGGFGLQQALHGSGQIGRPPGLRLHLEGSSALPEHRWPQPPHCLVDRAAGAGHRMNPLQVARHRAQNRYRRIALAETAARSEEHTSELQSLMRISYAVFCLK